MHVVRKVHFRNQRICSFTRSQNQIYEFCHHRDVIPCIIIYTEKKDSQTNATFLLLFSELKVKQRKCSNIFSAFFIRYRNSQIRSPKMMGFETKNYNREFEKYREPQ